MSLEGAVELYRAGLSLRQVAARYGVNATTIRNRVRAAGGARGRLDYQGTDADRLLNYAVTASGCWEWQGYVNNMGYGLTAYLGRRTLVHRAMCDHHGRPIPPGMDACHRCDNTRCCNPDHIFAGTRADNMQDASRKGRLRVGEASSSAKLTAEAVISIRQMVASGLSQREVARRTGAHYKNVNAIVLRRIWKHLP